MDKYEYKVSAEEIKDLIARGEYVQAAQIADTIDWRRVKSVMMLCTISDLYKINRRYEDARNMLLLAYERRPGGRTICYSLCELCIKTEEYVQALNYYKEFVQVAQGDPGRYILQYKLYEAQDVSLEERIGVLEELKKRDYREKWAYELAYLYHRVGLETRCVEECDEMILWFGEGRYVIKAMELKMLHQPLSPAQQEKYDSRFGVPQDYQGYETDPGSQVSGEPYGENAGDAFYGGEYPVEDQYAGTGYAVDGAGQYVDAWQYGDAVYQDGGQGYEAGSYATDGAQEAAYGQAPYRDAGSYQEGTEPYGGDGYGQAPYDDAIYQDGGQAYGAETYAAGGYGNIPYDQEIYSNGNVVYQEDVTGYGTGEMDTSYQNPPAVGVEQYGGGDAVYAEDGQAYTAGSDAYPYGQMYGQEAYVAEPEGVPVLGAPQPDRAADEMEIQVKTMDVSQYNTINLQAELAAGLREVLKEEPGRSKEAARMEELTRAEAFTRSVLSPMTETDAGQPGPGNAQTIKSRQQEALQEPEEPKEAVAEVRAGADKENYFIQNIEEVESSEVFFGETEEIGNLSLEALPDTVLETQGEPVTQRAALPEEAVKTTEESSSGGSKAAPGKENEVMTAQPPRELADVLSQESDGQISLVMPESERIEKQITGQMNIEEVLAEWEQMKKENAQKQKEEVRKRVLQQTGDMFTEFEASVRDGLLERLENGLPVDLEALGQEQESGESLARESMTGNSTAGKEDASGEEEPAVEEDLEGAEEYAVEEDLEGPEEYAVEGDFEGPEEYAVEGDFEGVEGYAVEGDFEGSEEYAVEGDFEGAEGYAVEGDFEGVEGYAVEGDFEGSEEYAVEGDFEGAEEYTGEADGSVWEEDTGYYEKEIPGESGIYGETDTYEEADGYLEEPGKTQEEPSDGEGITETEESLQEEETSEAGESLQEERASETEESLPEERASETGESFRKEEGEEAGRNPSGEEDITGKREGDALVKAGVPRTASARPDPRNRARMQGKITRMPDGALRMGIRTPQKPPVERDPAKPRSLTREEKELYGPFIQSRAAREQLAKAIDNISMAAFTGNIIVTGEEGMDTLTLAKNMIREVQVTDSNFSGKVAKISGKALNKKDVEATLKRLKSGALIIEKAPDMEEATTAALHKALQQESMGIIIVLEGTRKAINKLLEREPELAGCFTARVDMEALSNDMLVAFGKQYAREKEYFIDDLGVLALHTRVDELQTSDHVVTVMEVKNIVDQAIRHANRKTMGHFFDILLAKRYDEEDMIILSEKDFV